MLSNYQSTLQCTLRLLGTQPPPFLLELTCGYNHSIYIAHSPLQSQVYSIYRLYQAFLVHFLFFLSFVFNFSLSINCPQMSKIATPLKHQMLSPLQISNIATLSNVATPLNLATAPLGYHYCSNIASPPQTLPLLKCSPPPLYFTIAQILPPPLSNFTIAQTLPPPLKLYHCSNFHLPPSNFNVTQTSPPPLSDFTAAQTLCPPLLTFTTVQMSPPPPPQPSLPSGRLPLYHPCLLHVAYLFVLP